MKTESLSRINNICLIILTSIALTVALIYTKGILVPFFISLCIFIVLAPITARLRNRFKLPHAAAMALVFLGFVILVALLILFMSGSIESFLKGAHIYKTQLESGLENLRRLGEQFGYSYDASSIRSMLSELPILQKAQQATGILLGLMGNSFLITIFVLFLLAGQGAGTKIQSKLFDEVQAKISKYIIFKFFVSLGTGTLVGILLMMCGVDLALMFAILTVLLNFIPSVGSIIATALPLPIVLLQYGLGWQFAVVLIGSALIQVGIGNVLEPKIMGESMDLHPVTILVFLMFWGLVWGIPGMFLAVPITAILKIILARIETTRPVAELFAGRWATN